ncbi:hypothetical protein V2J09_010696 [Rumex salicifolius]
MVSVWKSSGVLKDSTTWTCLLQAYAETKKLKHGKQLHARLIRSGDTTCKFTTNHLINMYAKCGHIEYAHKLFDKMPRRNIVSWSAMVTGFAQNRQYEKSLDMFCQMWAAGVSATQFAFSSVIQASASIGSVKFGKQLHCLSLRCGFSYELFVGSSLADMYSKCGSIYDACKVFEEMPYKDEVSWTSMIDGYAKNGDYDNSLLAFKEMLNEGIVVDHYVLCSTLSACGAMKCYRFGRGLHSAVVKLGFEKESFVGNALTDMYSKAGDMVSASGVHGRESGSVNIVSYTSLIDGFVETDQIEKALSLFNDLRRQGIEPNEYTFSSLIKACANQASLEQGIQLHAQVVKFNLRADPFVSSSLVDMYGKCGLLDQSVLLFSRIKTPTQIASNSLMGAFAQHGHGKEALDVFNRMVSQGVKPNAITFINLLIGCSRAGLVQQGLDYFHSMETKYKVTPKSEHYSCVIDMLSRAGKLKEAEEFIKAMPFEPNAFGWCSFLAASKARGDKQRGEMAAKKLMEIEPDNSGAHVLLSNIYAKEKRWEDVRSLRLMMRDSNLKKLPGYSWVDVGNKTHVFEAEDSSHPQKAEIYEKLDRLACELKDAGYVPETDLIPYEMDDKEKERALLHHSEKIAVSFALISVPSGKPIIIKKNLRVCRDCHSAMKLISEVSGRVIILRDNSRFHHFSNGSCSCGDYW